MNRADIIWLVLGALAAVLIFWTLVRIPG